MFVNGVGKIKLQTIVAVMGGIFNIPLSILFAKYLGMGSAGVMIGTILCVAPAAIITPLQYRKILNGTARGIWNA
jgi:Na+-driven multidrug efflux pump